jgi:hypothetical protein
MLVLVPHANAPIGFIRFKIDRIKQAYIIYNGQQ